jgi:hypothetical protein
MLIEEVTRPEPDSHPHHPMAEEVTRPDPGNHHQLTEVVTLPDPEHHHHHHHVEEEENHESPETEGGPAPRLKEEEMVGGNQKVDKVGEVPVVGPPAEVLLDAEVRVNEDLLDPEQGYEETAAGTAGDYVDTSAYAYHDQAAQKIAMLDSCLNDNDLT